MGRTFDGQLYDMFELGLENFKGMKSFSTEKAKMGHKPCFIITGEEFEQKSEYQTLANLFIGLII